MSSARPYHGQRPHELLVDAREIVEPPAPPRLQRPLAEAEMAALLEPAVEVEHPVDRLHPVIGEEEDGRLLAVLRRGGVDQLAAERVDASRRPAGARRRLPVDRVRGMLRVEAGVAEVADVVGAHEVDAEKPRSGSSSKASLQTPAICSACSSSRPV